MFGPICGLDGHTVEVDVAEVWLAGFGSGNGTVVLEVMGEFTLVVPVHVIDNSGFGGCVFACLVGHAGRFGCFLPNDDNGGNCGA